MSIELMPASPVQNCHRLLAANDGNKLLNLAGIGVTCQGTADPGALKQVASKLAYSHDILRTGYEIDAHGVMHQFVVEQLDIDS